MTFHQKFRRVIASRGDETQSHTPRNDTEEELTFFADSRSRHRNIPAGIKRESTEISFQIPAGIED